VQGEDYVHHVFQDLVPGKVLFTGFVGGFVWEKSMLPTEVLRRKDLSGSSLGEFRLSRDFVHLPIPCIGGLRHPDIYQITHSVEMAPYSIGGNYDRPIPRRIVESAGVPRAVFGQRKLAVGLIFYRIAALISTKGHADLATFEKELGLSWRERAYAALLRIRWQVRSGPIRGLRAREPPERGPAPMGPFANQTPLCIRYPVRKEGHRGSRVPPLRACGWFRESVIGVGAIALTIAAA
jgi:hypothetical protein